MKALRKNRFTVARLQLQNLLETYEDSEFSRPGQVCCAESFLLRSRSFQPAFARNRSFGSSLRSFPDHELADDAQLKVAMTHIKQLQKPDRDDTEARLAEFELNVMINQLSGQSSAGRSKGKAARRSGDSGGKHSWGRPSSTTCGGLIPQSSIAARRF